MKKTNVIALNEIKAGDIQRINDYLEETIQLLTSKMLNATNGVITGLTVTQTAGQNNKIDVSSGAVHINGLFAQLESTSGAITLTLPGAGTSTYTVAAYYQEVLDTPASGYVLVDVNTRVEQVQTNPTRRFGACKIQAFTGAAPGSLSSGYVILATVTCSTTAITAISTTTRQTAVAGVSTAISDAATNNSTSIQASSTPSANKLLPLTSAGALVLGTGNFQAASGLFTGSLTVQGTLNVPSGSAIQTSNVTANSIILNSNVTGAPTLDASFAVERGSSTDAALFWREGTDNWEFTVGGVTIVTGGLTVSAGNIAGTTASFTDTVTVDKTNTKGLLIGTAASGSRLYSTATGVDTVDMSGVLTGLTASSGITITGSGHSRTIQNTGVLSVAGSGAISASTTAQATTVSVATATSGALGVVKIGSGLSVDGTGNVTNADKGSSQSIYKNIANSAGTTQFSAGSNSDSLRFAAGTGLGIAFDNVNDMVTYSNTGVTSLAAGTAISVNASSGAVIVTNTGVTSAVAGTGITVSAASGAVTFTNSDRGSSQNIFKNIANSAGTTQFSAATNTDTIRFAGSGAASVTFDNVTKTVTITATDTTTALSSTNTDIKALGTQSAGSLSTAAKADHVHPTTGLALTGSTNTFTLAQNFSAGLASTGNITTTGNVTATGNVTSLEVVTNGKTLEKRFGKPPLYTSQSRSKRYGFTVDSAYATEYGTYKATLPGAIDGIIYAGGFVWGYGYDSGTTTFNIYKVNTSTMTSVNTYSFSMASSGIVLLAAMESDGTNIWFADWYQNGSKVFKFNMSAGTLTYALTPDPAIAISQRAAVWDGTYIWMAGNNDSTGSGSKIYKINPTTNAVVSSYAVPADTSSNVIGLEYDGTNIWYVDISDNSFGKLVIATGIVTRYKPTNDGYAKPLNQPYNITFDGRYLFIGCGGSTTGSVMKFTTGGLFKGSGDSTFQSGKLVWDGDLFYQLQGNSFYTFNKYLARNTGTVNVFEVAGNSTDYVPNVNAVDSYDCDTDYIYLMYSGQPYVWRFPFLR